MTDLPPILSQLRVPSLYIIHIPLCQLGNLDIYTETADRMSVPKSFRAHLGRVPSTVSLADRDSILVIIDAQNEYAEGILKISDETITYSRPNILTLLQRYRAAHAPVAHVVHVTPPGAPVFTPDTPLAEAFPELAPQLERTSPDAPDLDFEVLVPKRFPGSFAETILDDVVKRAGVKKVVLTGYMAHVCVSTTAREAAQRGYDVVVVGGCGGGSGYTGGWGRGVGGDGGGSYEDGYD
ncbi:Secreted isochorismatase effector Isc1 [Mycena sanguinolenta]|uniref:Secreted isochorismatase effector Isc1 n=1 Tax=Mycena sanguinolenta TaxID=230812 RepID=A0A8H6XIE0_9AGAR|nr:Secreted isochorismatase effector Isc1 [Mycena sanguinolenta]